MKRIFNTLGVVLALGLGFTSCQEEVRQLEYTDQGPEMTVDAFTADVYMGGNIKFDVTLSDEKFDLSTLKAELLFEDAVVSEFNLRTKEYGKYEGNLIHCPLLANIPNGEAKLALAAQNVGMGITRDTLYITVKRPDFDELTLVSEGQEYKMKKTAGYQYALTGDFPADLPAVIKTPAVNEDGDVITIGWDGTALAAGVEETIPFSMGTKGGNYEVTVDLMNLTAAPFNKLAFELSESKNVVIVDLIQGAALVPSGISDLYAWNLDFDFFSINDDQTVTFKALNGRYRLAANFEDKFIRVDVWNPETDNYAKMNLDNPSASAIYAIGPLGKPDLAHGFGWNTTDGAWCLAQHEPNVYQISLMVGSGCDAGLDWKIFNERGWGSAFEYASLPDEVAISDGNLKPTDKPLKTGQGYTFKFDLTKGDKAVVLTLEEVELPGASPISVNGASTMKVSDYVYKVPAIELKKGDAITIEGLENVDLKDVITDVSSWMTDPDYQDADGKFAAMDGYYALNLYIDRGYYNFQRVDKDGNKLTAKNGALWMMGWGITNSYWDAAIKDQNQIAFNPGSAYCMAEVEPKVFQITGLSFDSEAGDKIDGRWRFNDFSIKWFGQDGWGDEKGKIFGSTTTVELTDRAKALVSDQGNLELVVSGMDGDKKIYKPLEKNVTYVLRIDLSKVESEGKEIVDFYKK